MALSVNGYGSHTMRFPGPTVAISSAVYTSDVHDAGFFAASSEKAEYIRADSASDSSGLRPDSWARRFSNSGYTRVGTMRPARCIAGHPRSAGSKAGGPPGARDQSSDVGSVPDFRSDVMVACVSPPTSNAADDRPAAMSSPMRSR